MARALDPIWDCWSEDGGETFEVGDLGIDLDDQARPIAVLSNQHDADLLVFILRHTKARLP